MICSCTSYSVYRNDDSTVVYTPKCRLHKSIGTSIQAASYLANGVVGCDLQHLNKKEEQI